MEKHQDNALAETLKHKNFERLTEKFKQETKDLMVLFEHNNKLPSKPIHKELEIINDNLEMVAYVDVIGEDYIVDYKTSGYKGFVPSSYIWQLKIYAMLYYLKTGKLIRNVGVYYVKYGRIEWFKIDEAAFPNIEKVVRHTIKCIKEYEKLGDKDKCTYSGKYTCACKRVSECQSV